MIRIIKRCMTKSELTEKKWDGHFAFFHLKEFKNQKDIYLNGKRLKWYHRFKNGDIIEIIETPKGVVTALFGAVFWSIAAALPAAITLHAGIIAGIAGLALAGTIGFKALTGARASASATTRHKEYSSTTQPELKGANNEISNDIIPVVFGTTQQTPSYAQTPFRLVSDGTSTNKYHQYFIPNYNNVVYSDFKLGETSINNYVKNYIDLNTLYGGNTFLGFENIKALSIDEELSFNSKENEYHTAVWDIDRTISLTGFVISVTFKLQADIVINSSNVSELASKTFKITVKAHNGSTEITKTGTITVNNTDWLFNVEYIRYQHLFEFLNTAITKIDEISIEATSKTRNNTFERINNVDISIGRVAFLNPSFEEIEYKTLDESINNYDGIVSEVVNTSPENTTDIDVIISFPSGLYSIVVNTGDRRSRSVNIDIKYKSDDMLRWEPISSANDIYIRGLENEKIPLSESSTTVSGSTVTMKSPSSLNVADQLFFRPIGFTLPAGKYTVSVRSADFKDKGSYSIGYPNVSEIQFRVDGQTLNTNILPKVNQIRFIATAYKGLSGTLQKFNYIAKAKIPIWNGTNWNTKNYTSNPAAIIRYLLTDESVNPRAESIDHIDNDSLVEYYEWCEESGYKADGCIAEAVKIGEIINEILKNSQAVMIPLFNGKHTFVIDKPNKTPIGLFNQHNSWNFKWTPNVGRLTEAIRASFVENDDWTEDELTLYWYDNDVHDTPEIGKSDSDYYLVKKDYKYVCNRNCVRDIVEYELKTTQTKRNTFEFTVNLEAMNMMLLDRVYISNTANMQNESSGLIKSVKVNNGQMYGFDLYSTIDIPENAKIVIRSLDYENQKAVINIYDVINQGRSDFVEINPVIYSGVVKGAGNITGINDTWYYDGDLFTLGQETIYDCTVTDIKYNDDGTATITARDY